MKSLFRHSMKWSSTIAVITLVLAAIFSIVSTFLLNGLSWSIGVVVVFLIVLIGILFDIIGVAATAVDIKPFHAMAAKKVHGSKQAVRIAKNADRFSNFCNDVVGDISGIVSGTATTVVVLELTLQFGFGQDSIFQTIVSVLFTSVVAALTVGGKSLGKTFAIHHSTRIIFAVGRLTYFIENHLKITVIPENKSKKPSTKNSKK